MKITIVGCGNAGLIHAAKIYEKEGNQICILKTSQTNSEYFDKIVAEGGYRVHDLTNRGKDFFVKPELITRDAKAAMDFAEIVLVMTTTLQHESVAKLIAPFAHDGQIIAMCPGYMGSLIFKKYVKADVIYSEWETTAYNGRVMNNDYVKITFYNPRNAISVLPTAKSQYVLDKFSKLFDNTHYLRQNILESALHNPNMIVHTIGMTFSASRIEYSKGEFWMYREAFTDSIVRVINAFDKQKNEVLKAYGCEPLDYFEAAKWRNEEDLTVDAMTSFRSFADSSNKGPMFLRHRYLLEDVPMGLGLFVSLGKVAGVDTSIAESIMTLGGALLGEDFKSQSRSIQYLLQKEEVTLHEVINVIS
ncbi:MAG: NAD/NADP octopine/nopaline dehydrogenase family protein [Bacteroidales bacterium]|nr:NAD/NADP octopine/nopaline dehydrogenase family protein [Bacteroidales bacterium]